MPLWKPEELWRDEDVFVIGGGPSLQGFDWQLLVSEKTLGCNSAFKLGPAVCKACVFGDKKWWEFNRDELAKYAAHRPVYTNCTALFRQAAPWLRMMPREGSGLHREALGWNGNTGAAAINLALVLGARRVYLLGFDLKARGAQSNWHAWHPWGPPRKPPYQQFLRGFNAVWRDWHAKFNDRKIVNLVIGDSSALPESIVPRIELDKFWFERKSGAKDGS